MASYSYSGDPSASNKDFIRFKSADTDVSGGASSADFSDEEIAAVLTSVNDDKWRATDIMLRQRIQKFTRLALNAGSDQLDLVVSAANAAHRAFLAEAAQQGITLNIQAQTISGKETLSMDTNAVQPRFYRDMHSLNNPPFSTLDN